MTLRTDAELDDALTRLSEQRGISKQEVLRRAVLEMRDREVRRARVDEVAAGAMTDYADALDRLGRS